MIFFSFYEEVHIFPLLFLTILLHKDPVGEDDGEEVGGSAAGRRKKMRTTFTGKQVSVLIFSKIIFSIYSIFAFLFVRIYSHSNRSPFSYFLTSYCIYSIFAFTTIRNRSRFSYFLKSLYIFYLCFFVCSDLFTQ